MADIDIAIGLDTKEATQNLGNFKSKMQQDLGGLEKSFGSFAKIGASIAAGFAALKIGQFLADGIKEAIEAEKALAKLANQLKVTGEFSEAAVKEFDDFASAVERSTNVSGEAVLEQAALAKSFGLTNEESKNLIRAATQLSAVTGDSLSTSVDTLIKSYQGQSRQLSKVIGETANLTKEQLRSGAAIDLINAKYGGTAEAALNTYSGALTALERSFTDIGKEIGKAIIGNDKLIGVIRAVTGAFEDIIDFIATNKGQINSFVTVLVDGFFGAAKAITFVASVIERALGGAIVAVTIPLEGLLGAFEALARVGGKATEDIANGIQDANVFLKNFNNSAIKGVTDNTGAFGLLNEKIISVQASIKSVGKQAVETSNTINKAAGGTRNLVRPEDIERAKQSYKSLSNEIFQSVATETEKVNAKRREQLEELTRINKLKILSAKEFAEAEKRIEEAAQKQLTEIAEREAQKRAVAQSRQGGSAGGVGARGAAGIAGVDGTTTVELNADAAEKALVSGLSTGANVITAALNGRDGAVQMASTIGSGVANAFLPGFGAAVGPLIAALSQDSETIRESTKEFVAAIPDLVVGILEGLYIVLELLVKGIAKAFLDGVKAIARGIEVFFQGIGKFLSSFADAMKTAFSGLGQIFQKAFETIGNFFGDIGTKIFDAIRAGAQAMVDSIGGVFQGFIDGITSVFDPIIDFFKNLNPFGGGGGGGFLGDIGKSVGKVFGFAEGGVVPPGFPNDTYPAFLTSGETVLPPGRSLPDETGNEVMVALLGQILNKLSEPMQVSTTAEVNGRALADIILQLNRNSARLAV